MPCKRFLRRFLSPGFMSATGTNWPITLSAFVSKLFYKAGRDKGMVHSVGSGHLKYPCFPSPSSHPAAIPALPIPQGSSSSLTPPVPSTAYHHKVGKEGMLFLSDAVAAQTGDGEDRGDGGCIEGGGGLGKVDRGGRCSSDSDTAVGTGRGDVAMRSSFKLNWRLAEGYVQGQIAALHALQPAPKDR